MPEQMTPTRPARRSAPPAKSTALRVSLWANVALIAVVAFLLWRERTGAEAPLKATPPPSQPALVRAAAAPASDRNEPAPAQRDGAQINPAALAYLEQLGLKRSLVVSALLEDFHKRWDQRVTDLERSYAPRAVPEREYIELGRLRDAERIRELKAALGEDGYARWDKERTLGAVNGAGLPMTDAETEAVYRLQKDFERRHTELQMAMEDGIADRADAAALQGQAQQALERELERVLGKERLAQLRGFSDPVADVYRTFGDLNPTPDQAAEIVRLDQARQAREDELRKRLAENPGAAATLSAELKAMNDAREENLKRMFGADAYERTKQQNDPTYKTLTQYAGAWELKPEEVSSVYQSLQAFHDQAERTRLAAQMSESAGQAIDWRAINAAIEQARQQTEAGLLNAIGAERLRRLKQNGLLTSR